MDNIIDGLRAWKKEHDSHIFRVNNVYEISVDSCQFKSGWPNFSGPEAWMCEGMTNNTKPMWAISVGENLGETLGFVWSTRISQKDFTVQEIVGVQCELWKTDQICYHPIRDPDRKKERMNLLGTTKLRGYKIREIANRLLAGFGCHHMVAKCFDEFRTLWIDIILERTPTFQYRSPISMISLSFATIHLCDNKISGYHDPCCEAKLNGLKSTICSAGFRKDTEICPASIWGGEKGINHTDLQALDDEIEQWVPGELARQLEQFEVYHRDVIKSGCHIL